MSGGPLSLALAYLRHYRLRTAILVACLGVVLVLPAATQLLLWGYESAMTARARATPLVIGARGSRNGLVLGALYFRPEALDPISAGLWDELLADGRGLAVPIHAGVTARGRPVIGTSLDYFAFRGLALARGTLPRRLGDVVAGAGAARALDLKPGDRILTDPKDLYNLAGAYPLWMRVTGVLAERSAPDDDVLFVDVKTAWIAAGIGHGHEDLAPDDRTKLLRRAGNRLVANASVTGYTEITAENLASFHFHGEPAAFPLSAIILRPHTDKDRTILLGRYQDDPKAQILAPAAVIGELMGLVFRIKMVFDAQFGLVLAAMALLFALIVALSLRMRRREMETLSKIGCARGTVAAMLAWEVGIVVVAALVLGAAGALALARVAVSLRLI